MKNTIKPKIIIEPLMRDEIYISSEEIQVYCINGLPHFILRFEAGNTNFFSLYDKNLNIVEDTFFIGDENIERPFDNLIKQAFDLSKKLSKDFLFVRVDWMVYKNKIFFEELTFTPYSGFSTYLNKKFNKKLGKLLNLERF